MKNINEKELHELFDKLKKKEKIAYEQLYQKYSSLVYKIAFSILKDKETAEDIMQNVFIKITNLSEEKLPSNYEASWLYTVTKNEAISYIRKNKETVSIEEISEESEVDKIEEMLEKESYETLISSLEQQEKQIISLKIEVGLTFKEIAKLLNMPIGTIQWKYYKSLHSLKLLIGNLSLFIVTGILTITRLLKTERTTTNIEKQESVKDEIQEKENGIILEDVQKEESIEQSYRNEETILENKNEEDKQPEKEELQEETHEEIKQEIIKKDMKLDFVDITLIGITSIFLCFTIFSTIIFANHQQKRKKKASKR